MSSQRIALEVVVSFPKGLLKHLLQSLQWLISARTIWNNCWTNVVVVVVLKAGCVSPHLLPACHFTWACVDNVHRMSGSRCEASITSRLSWLRWSASVGYDRAQVGSRRASLRQLGSCAPLSHGCVVKRKKAVSSIRGGGGGEGGGGKGGAEHLRFAAWWPQGGQRIYIYIYICIIITYIRTSQPDTNTTD